MLDNENSNVFTGTGIGYHLKDIVPFLMKRKFAERTSFITVYDFSPSEDNRIKTIEILPVFSDSGKLDEADGVGLRIITQEKIITIGLDMREKISKQTTVSTQRFNRLFCNIRNFN